MYFENRQEAGVKLYEKLKDLERSQTVIVCLSKGSVLVGDEIAKRMHCQMTLLLTRNIKLPGPGGAEIGVLDQAGALTHSGMFSAGELEEFESEYHGYIEQEKMMKMHEMHLLLGEFGNVDVRLLKNHNIILVSDGLKSGASLDAAASFLKPIKTTTIVVATPFTTAEALDKMKLISNRAEYLDVKQNYMGKDHYYEKNDIPDDDKIKEIIRTVSNRWIV